MGWAMGMVVELCRAFQALDPAGCARLPLVPGRIHPAPPQQQAQAPSPSVHTVSSSGVRRFRAGGRNEGLLPSEDLLSHFLNTAGAAGCRFCFQQDASICHVAISSPEQTPKQSRAICPPAAADLGAAGRRLEKPCARLCLPMHLITFPRSIALIILLWQ